MITHLLTKTAIFVPLDNDCFCQLTGKPLVYILPPTLLANAGPPPVALSKKRAFENDEDDGQATKRRKLSDGEVKGPSSLQCVAADPKHKRRYRTERSQVCCPNDSRSPINVNFERVRMFYARPSFLPHSRTIAVGLPPQRMRHVADT